MKSPIILSLLFLFVVSCKTDSAEGSKEQKMSFESKFYDCIKTEYKQIGISVEDYFRNLEALAIKTGNLKDTSAEAYYEMFKISGEKAHFPIGNDAYYFHFLTQIPNFPLNLACTDPLVAPMDEVENSLFYAFNRAFSIETLESRKDSTQANIGKVVIQVYKVEDFEEEYNKLALLSLIAHRSYVENPIYETE